MNKILTSIFICVLYTAAVILTEAFLGVTIIWFWDYGYSLNIPITVFVFVALALHYLGLCFFTNHKIITFRTSNYLLCFDILVCAVAFFAVFGGMINWKEASYGQMIFAVTIHIVILLARILVYRRLKVFNT